MIIKIATIVCCTALTMQVNAQEFNAKKVDSYLNVLEQNNKFMGSVVVKKNGNLLYSRSVGYVDADKKIKADKDSKYRIGSISKTFTSVLVMKGVEEKKIDLNKTIDNYFPTIKNAGRITIKQLLYHRSGIHNFTDDEEYLTWNTQQKTEKEMIEIISKSGSDFDPNSKAEYSNSNFVLLTYILQKEFQKNYSELIQQYIATPLQLKNTYLGGKINSTNNECKSYTFIGSWNVESETDISIPLGAGGIVSTPIDIATFSDALFGGKLISDKSVELMKTIKDDYGIGLFKIPFYDKIGYGHTGGIDGFSSVFSHFDDGEISFAMCSNGSNYNNNDIAIAVLSAVYDKNFEIPEFSSIQLSDSDLDKYLGVYASTEIPLKITITKNNNTLVAQGTDQPAFPLEVTSKDKFKFDKASAIFEFNPEEKTFILKQGGGQIKFSKE